MEKIGKVIIDDAHYPGEDKYCDGEIEDRLLKIVMETDPEDYDRVIEKEANWPVLYHLSEIRENVVRFLPSGKNLKVLEIGSGCGAITGALSEMYGSVTCVDLSRKRSLINAYRHIERDNINIKLGNFTDIEPELDEDFDYIFLIGVFEYARGYVSTDDPYVDFLNLIKKHVKKDGRIVIAIENQYGLKYFAGCREDHAALYFEGIENYRKGGVARTFGKKGLSEIFNACGLTQFTFYYPYPDYKLPTVIYSDKYLPRVGELISNLRNFDNERLSLFDEKEAFDGIIEGGLFDTFANSYIAVIGTEPLCIYTKFSNDRRKEYRIATSIYEGTENEEVIRVVKKSAVSGEAEGHIASLEEKYKLLSEKYRGFDVRINRLRMEGEDAVCLSYINGHSLEEELDRFVEKGDTEGFNEKLSRFNELCSYNEKAEVSDFDLIFSNIMVDDESGEWTIIDYEWTYMIARSGSDTMKRALFVYMTGPERRRRFLFDNEIAAKYGVFEEDIKSYENTEHEFQHMVTSDRLSLYELYDRFGKAVRKVPVEITDKEIVKNPEKRFLQLYIDNGEGFSEETSVIYDNVFTENSGIKYAGFIHGDIKAFRLDPCCNCCILRDLTIRVNGVFVPVSLAETNGVILPGGIAFGTDDPGITFDMKTLKKKFKMMKISDEIKIEFECKIQYLSYEEASAFRKEQ